MLKVCCPLSTFHIINNKRIHKTRNNKSFLRPVLDQGGNVDLRISSDDTLTVQCIHVEILLLLIL